MISLATLVNWSELFQSVAAGAISAILLTTVVSLGIRGTAKYVDYSQDGRMFLAYSSLAVGGICFLVTLAMIILGISLMVNG